MKARVKANGEIVEIVQFLDNDKFPTTYDENELEFFPNYNYWDRLLHQYAGMAMQGILSKPVFGSYGNEVDQDAVIECAMETAHALVEKRRRLKHETKTNTKDDSTTSL